MPPSSTATRDNFVRIPKNEYAIFLEFKKIKTFTPTSAQKKALLRAEQNFKSGKTFSFHEFTKQLGFTN
jgi:hypothetical protein